MKKIIALLLSAVLVLGLMAGCGKEDNKETHPSQEPSGTVGERNENNAGSEASQPDSESSSGDLTPDLPVTDGDLDYESLPSLPASDGDLDTDA